MTILDKDLHKTDIKKLHKPVLVQISAFVIGAFSLVAALAWNTAIQAIFKKIFGTADSILAQLSYAIIVTIIAVVVTWWIARAIARVNDDAEVK